MSKNRLLISFLFCPFIVFAAASEDVEVKSQKSNFIENKHSTARLSSSDLQHAKSWGLSNKQYARYKEILRSPRAYFTPNLDKNPLLALALEAESDSERAELADAWVRIQYQNNINIVKWQLTVSDAWNRNYPDIPRFAYKNNANKHYAISKIDGLNSNLINDLLSKKRAELYLKTNCSDCIDEFKSLRKQLDSNKIEGIDVFFVNKPTHEEMIDWALQQNISIEEVSKLRVITLNYARKKINKLPLVKFNKG